MQPHRQQPTRLPRHWDSPGKNTGVGCHLLLQCMKVKSESEVTQLCPTLSDLMDCSLPGSSVHGIFQARVLEWGAIAFSAPRLPASPKFASTQAAALPTSASEPNSAPHASLVLHPEPNGPLPARPVLLPASVTYRMPPPPTTITWFCLPPSSLLAPDLISPRPVSLQASGQPIPLVFSLHPNLPVQASTTSADLATLPHLTGLSSSLALQSILCILPG